MLVIGIIYSKKLQPQPKKVLQRDFQCAQVMTSHFSLDRLPRNESLCIMAVSAWSHTEKITLVIILKKKVTFPWVKTNKQTKTKFKTR